MDSKQIVAMASAKLLEEAWAARESLLRRGQIERISLQPVFVGLSAVFSGAFEALKQVAKEFCRVQVCRSPGPTWECGLGI